VTRATSERLRVAVDATPLIGVRTGIGRIVGGLLDALAPDASLDLRAYAITWRGRSDLAASLPAGVRAATRPFPARLARVAWLRVDVPRLEMWTGPVDVAHATNYVAPPSRAPTLLSVYDLTFLHHPELCTPDVRQYPTLVRRALARGAWVHTTSEFVRGEVIEAFAVPPERVVCVYPGLGPVAGGDAEAGRVLAGSPRYVLALGTVEPRKNLPVLTAAFDRAADEDRALTLVVAGPDGWGTDELDAARTAARHGDRIVRLGYVSDAARRDLLAGATVFAYPSKYEGFGLPPLEAMVAGVPVVASRAGSIPEVSGDAALLVEPDDVDGLAEALSRAASDDTIRHQLVERGRLQVAQFGWERTRADMVALYRNVA
jgi:glycosyltransferase involved in cell wall biosynthesis